MESYIQFHSKIFSAKFKEFIGRQTDHRLWNLGAPSGFMGHTWRPGDDISAALLWVKLVGWVDEWDSDRGDFRCGHAINTSSFKSIIFKLISTY